MAKEQKQPESIPVLETTEEVGPPKSYRLQIACAVATLILFQLTVLWFLMPPRVKPIIGGINPVDGIEGYERVDTEPRNVVPRDDTAEKSIKEGPFRITVRDLENDLTTTYSLVIHVLIRKKEERRFQTRYDQCVQQIITRVESELRASSVEEWQEVELTSIGSRVMMVINDVLGHPWVLEVLPTEFSFQVH